MALPAVDRRGLLVGGGAVAGLVIAFALWPRSPGSPLRAAREGEEVFGSYLRIGNDGRVVLAVPQAETGQGIWTGLAQVAADELGADWELVSVEPAPVTPGYDNALAEGEWGRAMRLTAGSTSIRAFEAPIRKAAASARALLCAAAAETWDVAAHECDTFRGEVRHGGRRLGFGALVERAARIGPMTDTPLRPVRSGGLSGQPLRRLDLNAKASGSWRFAGDVRLPNMVFASIRMAPPRGRLRAFDRSAAERPDIKLIVNDHWLAAIGPTWWAAEQALKRAGPQFTGPTNADTPTIEAALHAMLKQGKFKSFAEQGDYDSATDGLVPLPRPISPRRRCISRWNHPRPLRGSSAAGWKCGRRALPPVSPALPRRARPALEKDRSASSRWRQAIRAAGRSRPKRWRSWSPSPRRPTARSR